MPGDSSERLWMGLDISTQSVRALVVGSDGETVGAGSRELRSERSSGRHQQDPEEPGRPMMDTVTRRLDLPPESCVMVGDRLYTDLAAADTAGMCGALVLTGETDAGAVERMAGDKRPDYVLARIDRLLPRAEWERRGWEDEP